MEKKTKRRRRPSSVKKTSKKTIRDLQKIKEEEAKAPKIRNVMPEAYYRTGYERLNQIPELTEKLKDNVIENIIAAYYSMTTEGLKKVKEDPNITVLELSLLQMLQKSISKDEKNAHDISKYLHNRMGGKAKDRIEFSGPKGEALEVRSKYVPDFDAMNQKQLEEFEQLLMKVNDAPLKEIKEDDEE